MQRVKASQREGNPPKAARGSPGEAQGKPGGSPGEARGKSGESPGGAGIDPSAPKGQKETAQGRAKRRPGYA